MADRTHPIAQPASGDFEAEIADFDAPGKSSPGKTRRKATDPEAT
jgi:hypothetical protein